jgi:L-iditol 2-dehydrogenase
MTTGGTCVDVARLHGVGDIRLARESLADPRPDEVLVRITSVGLCGSDLHWYREAGIGDAVLERPLVLGHEFSGVVVDGPRAGERVVADPADPCGRCDACLTGGSNVCALTRFAGFGATDGALRSVMAWPRRLLQRLPDSVGDDEAALIEPLGVALHALDLGPVKAGGRAGVYGCGPLGLLLIQLLRIAGASVIVATDRLAHRVAAAAAMGATHGFVVDGPAGPDPLHGRSDAPASPVDVAFEVAGDDGALSDAIAAVRPRGRVVIVGIPEGDRTSFTAGIARRKELTLQLCRRMGADDLSRAVALAGSGVLDLAALVTHRYPLANAGDAFATLSSRRGLKVIVKPSAGTAGDEWP